jgi:hypothetical protein
MKSTKAKRPVAARKVEPVVGQFISSECLGNFYVNAPSGDVIAMTPIRMIADLIADALNTSKKRTAVLLRHGWTVGRDGQLFPPNPADQGMTNETGKKV